MAYIPLNINSNVRIQTHDATGELGTGHIVSAYVDTEAPDGEQITYLVAFENGSRLPTLVNESALYLDEAEAAGLDETPDSGEYPAG